MNLKILLKKFFSYPIFLILFLSFIGMMGFGAVVKYNYDGGSRFQFLQKIIMTIVEVPHNLRIMVDQRTFNLDKIFPLEKHKDKKKIEQLIENKRNALLVLPRYDHSLSRSIVDIVDLNNFKVIHTYKHDINEMNNRVTNNIEFPQLKKNDSSIRFQYQHPIILKDGSLIANSSSGTGVQFKIDFCSNLQWINDEDMFHHSNMLDHERNIWVGGRMKPFSQYVKKNKHLIKSNFLDDSIIKINTDGKILFNKSVIEILIENKLIDQNIFYTGQDPIHLNDIEPVLSDTKHWKQGDVFLSLRHQSSIVHYRPNTNKVINYITGPFAQQHDVDVISDKEISIFDNNNVFYNNNYSRIVTFNFETKKFKSLFSDKLQKNNFKTYTEGLSHIFKDGALMVEEQNHGRIILFNNQGEKEWEFVNKDINGDIGFISWSRVIEDQLFIEKFKLLIENKIC